MNETLRGGGSVGPYRYMGYHCSWPFASLTVDHDALTYRIFPLTYRFEKASIQCLVEERILLFRQLRIVHRKDGFPKWVVFAVFDFSKLRQVLERHGYSLRPQEDGLAVPDPSVRYSKTLLVVSIVCAVLGVLGAAAALFVTTRAR